jgi:hypothetical protein
VKNLKKATTIAGLLALSMIAIMAISTAAALSLTYVLISGPGTVWQFAPDPTLDWENSVTITATFHVKDSGTGYTTIPADELITMNVNKKAVTLIFDTTYTSQFKGRVDAVTLTVVDINSNTQIITEGPGFAWGRTR